VSETSFWHPFADMAVVRSGEFVLERGEDVWVWDTAGRRYLDATASLWYANVGHGRAEIREAVAAQLGKLEAYSTFGDFATEPALELSRRLAAVAPMHGARVFLGSGGGDGIDTAVKLARRYWTVVGAPERSHVISRTAGYHGTHGYGTALAGIEANREGVGELPEDTSRVAHSSVDEVEAAFQRLGPDRVAAFFIEPVIGAGGVYPPPEGYIEAVAELCREAGVLLVVDSVICAFGRLGSWFGIERWGVEPDMIVFAKGVTGGYLPLGGVVVSERIADPFWTRQDGLVFRHGATYAGHATCCAAALANLDILEREGLVGRGRELEGDLLRALTPLADHPLVAEARGGTGTLAALELDAAFLAERPAAVQEAFRRARDHGVIVRPLASALAVSPPLTATPSHFELITDALSRSLDEMLAAPTAP
jgi:putrescine---pyruvate transaminase